MSTLYIAMASVVFLIASILSMGDTEVPLNLYLSSIYLILLAIYYHQDKEK